MRDETAEQPAPLRSGLTTGSCATATSLAAARLLLTGQASDAVQITLPKGDASDEEVFLRLRQLATGYRASVDIGLSYTFGSFLNTIVNPRFNNVD